MSDTLLQTTSFAMLPNWSVQYLLQNTFSYNDKYPLVRIGDFLTRNKTAITVEDNKIYKRVTIKINNGGIYVRDTEKGINIGTKKQFIVKEGQFIVSKIDARNGAFGVVPTDVNNAIITGNFWTFDVDYNKINPHFLALITTTPEFIYFCGNASNGTTNRHYLQEDLFLEQAIPLPSLAEQNAHVNSYNQKIALAIQQEEEAFILDESIENYLFDQLGIEKFIKVKRKQGLQLINYVDLDSWNIINQNIEKYKSKKYITVSLLKDSSLAEFISRGKSPKYGNGKNNILNQKCNRWNDINLEFAKSVDDVWFNTIDSTFFTKEGDILINSTGEGTIGRSTHIVKEYEGLIFDSHLLLLRTDKSRLNPMFYTYLFNSKYGQDQVDDFKSAKTTKQTELGINNLKKVVFPLPPILKQKEIINYISDTKEKIHKLNISSKLNRLNAIADFEKEIFAV